MGVRFLNKFLQDKCYLAINKKLLFQLKHKTIVIDANNYLYRFLTEGDLIPSIYELCNIFSFYEITPIFIFDGPPPLEKQLTIENRQNKREKANKEYIELLTNINNIPSYDTYKNQQKLIQLNKKKVKLTNKNIREVKQLLDSLGIQYIKAEGEADKLCAQLVIQNEAYACMSEDMDLFVYGCPRVIRYLSILNHNCIFYDLHKILEILDMSHEEFKLCCILSGTDYNKYEISHQKIKNVYYYFKLFNTYKLLNSNNSNNSINFIEWLHKNNYIYDYHKIMNIIKLYIIENKGKTNFNSSLKNDDKLKNILKNHNFVFV